MGNGGNITAKLPSVGPSSLSGRIISSNAGVKAVCEAKGNPKPNLELQLSSNERIPCSQWESCGWDCRKCSWNLRPESFLEPRFTCIASNAISSDDLVLMPSDYVDKILSLSPDSQTVSIYGGSHAQSAVHLNLTVQLRNWESKREFLFE